MRIVAYSEMGIGKTECQDKILIGDTILSEGCYQIERCHFPLVVAVADGVGGSNAGEVASFMTVDGIRKWNRIPFLSEEDIRQEICCINEEIIRTSREYDEYAEMASTVTGLYLEYDDAILFHAGNTRVGLYTGYLEWLTDDHTVAAEAEYEDEVTEENMLTAGMGNADCSYLEDRLVVHKQNTYFFSGNVLLLTSDGIHDYVEDIEIEDLLKDSLAGKKWEQSFCRKLAELARECGSTDDISIVVIHERKDTLPEEEMADE